VQNLPDFTLQLGLLGGGGDSTTGTMISTLMYLTFIVFIFFGQKIQLYTMLWSAGGTLKKLDFMRTEVKKLTLQTIKEIGKPKDDPTPKLNSLLEHFLISPVNLDPAGIVTKFDHLLDVRDDKFKNDVKMIAPAANKVQLNNLENLVESSLALNTIYRIVRHFYLLGKKTSSFYLILQLQMILPLVMQEAEALQGASQAFAQGQPIGDGIGALVASKFMLNKKKRKVKKDVVVSETKIDGRKATVLKAEGPGGNVGKPGDAVKQIIKEKKGKVKLIIMVDAALKFEGEDSGEISEGIGAAIGGIGTEKFKIEEVASKYKIPLYAVIIKESIQDAISPMKKEINEATGKAIERIKALIKENTKKGDSIVIAGIGNTIGIGQ
jgi:hypothetical protein